MKLNKPFYAIVLLSLLCITLRPAIAGGKQSYTFGIVPQQTPLQLVVRWQPIFDYIKKETGISLVFKTAKDIPSFEKALSANAYDFAYMNPYHYIVYHKDNGYNAIAKEANKGIQGIIVTRVDSDIKDIQQLNGKTLAFPSPGSFAATILPIAGLKKAGIEVIPQYVTSHDSVYKSVAHSLYVAGGGIVRTLNATSKHERDQLRILWRTKKYTPHAIAARDNINPEAVRLIQDALAGMIKTEAGRKILQPLKIKGFDKAVDSDWDDVRSLNLHILDK